MSLPPQTTQMCFNYYIVKIPFVGLANDARMPEFMLNIRAPQSDAEGEQQQCLHTHCLHTH